MTSRVLASTAQTFFSFRSLSIRLMRNQPTTHFTRQTLRVRFSLPKYALQLKAEQCRRNDVAVYWPIRRTRAVGTSHRGGYKMRTEGQRNCGSKWLKQTMPRVLACRTYKRLNIVATRRPIGNWASDHQQSIDPDWPPVRSPGALPPTQQQHRSDKLTALADTQPIYCEISPMQSRRQALTSSRFVCMSVSHIYQYASSWTRQVSMSTSSIGLCLVNQSDFCGVSAADKCIGFA